LKRIKREYSNSKTPQQNEVAERKNRTLIEAPRTMLADLFLPTTFWAEPIWSAYSTTVKSSGDKIKKNTSFKTCEKPVSQVEQVFLEELKKLKRQEKEANDATELLRMEATNDIQSASTSSTNLINTTSTPLSTAVPSRAFNDGELSYLDPSNVKTASTPIETQKPLVKDEEATDVDVTPKTSHLQAVKRIFRYLKGQPKLGNPQQEVVNFLTGDLSHGNAKSRLFKELASPKQTTLGPDAKDDDEELYRDVNINLEGRDVQMIDVHTTQVLEDTHVTLTPVNPDGIDSLFESTPRVDVPVTTIVVPPSIPIMSRVQQAPAPTPTTTPSSSLQDLLNFVSKILPKIEKTVNEQLEAEVLTRSSNSSKTSYDVAADLSELELKKILIKKMENNKSIHRSNKQRNLYKAMVDSYECDKIILDTYGDTVTLKRRRDDADKDEEPFVGSDWGSKRRREGKEPESTSSPKFYEFAINRESARDVYLRRRIIVVTELYIVKWHDYKHLDWITVCRDDDKLYKFKESDFKRLRIQYIEDMLMLLVQGNLANLTLKERFAFNVSLRMFTRIIVIQQRMEDLQLGVKSYQKKLNLTKSDTDGTLNDVRTALYDRLKGIRMKYLPQTIWRRSDKERAAAMIQAIDKQLKTRRIMRSLEKSILTDSHVTPTKHGRMTKPFSSHRFIANCFNARCLKMEVECLSAKTTFWNEFSSTMVVQLLIDHQLGDMSHHKDIYDNPSPTKKVFANIKRVGTGFSRVVTPLFDNMLEEENMVLKDFHSVPSKDNTAAPVAKPYRMDLEHPEKVFSMQDVDDEEPAKVEEVLEVVTAAKLITEVVTIAGATTTTEATKRFNLKTKEKNAVIEQVKRSKRLNDAVIKYQALQGKPLTEAQARKNMIIYLKNMAGYKMNYFKGMTYSEIRPLFKKHYNYNQAFLKEVNKEVTIPEKEVEIEGHKREGESLEKEITKKQKMYEEEEELKSHLQIVSNNDDDVYTEATPLASKVPIVDYKIHLERNKPYFKIIRADGNHMLFLSFNTLLKNFDREDLKSI
nr:ribonuclease H-like domain-containing protein [Tanacetum cinerariifolium]